MSDIWPTVEICSTQPLQVHFLLISNQEERTTFCLDNKVQELSFQIQTCSIERLKFALMVDNRWVRCYTFEIEKSRSGIFGVLIEFFNEEPRISYGGGLCRRVGARNAFTLEQAIQELQS